MSSPWSATSCGRAACLLVLSALVRAAAASLVYTTGFDGPLDEGDGWRGWGDAEWQKIGTVVGVGALPPALVAAAHARNASALRAVAYDPASDLATAAAQHAWVQRAVGSLSSSGGDGLNLLLPPPPPPPRPAARRHLNTSSPLPASEQQQQQQQGDATTALVGALRAALRSGTGGRLLLTLALDAAAQARAVELGALVALLDFSAGDALVLRGYDACRGAASASASAPLDALGPGVASYRAPPLAVPGAALLVALPWLGFAFTCAPGGAETDGEEKMEDGEENVLLRMRQMHGWSLS